MLKANKHYIETTLIHFAGETREEIINLATHFSTITKSISALLLGFLFFFPAVQIILGTLLLYILFYPDTWNQLAKSRAVQHKHKAVALLVLSDLIINADTVFIIAAAAYISTKALIIAVIFLAILLTVVKQLKSRRKENTKPLPYIFIVTQQYFSVFTGFFWRTFPIIRSYTWTDVFHFMWIGGLAFQAAYMIVSDTLIAPLFTITMSERIWIGIISEIVFYSIFFWRWGVIQKMYTFLFRLSRK